jgi:glycosyltransferase involved in cell wall biosynthesis
MLTLIVATRNGARTLPDLFDALTRVDVPQDGWKIVLADNGSTDTTAKVVDGFRGRLPLHYVFEPEPGQNAARNAALPLIEGEFVAFTDDDTTPEPTWLSLLVGAARAHPDFDAFGGPVLPRWEREPPQWIVNEVDLGACFAVSPSERAEGPCDPRDLWSPNMLFRRAVFDAGYRFDHGMGPNGSSYAMGSETEFLARLRRDGRKAWFCRDARVGHYVRAFQLERDWILGRAVRFGRGQYRVHDDDSTYAGPLLFGVPRYRVRMAARQFLRLAHARIADRKRTFREHWELNYQIGQLIVARERFRRRPAPSR